jgi:ribosomal protein S18 acetylase RimI-like enzyme
MSNLLSEVRFDGWLSEMLKRDAYRLVFKDPDRSEGRWEPPEDHEFQRLLRHTPVFLYTKVQPKETDLICFLEERRFHLIDTNLIFSKSVAPAQALDSPLTVRFAQHEDEQAVVNIGRSSFTFSRFHLDNSIPKELANALKGEWVRNYFKGKRGQAMVVAEIGGVLAGFLLLLADEKQRTLTIDMIASTREHRRKGIAGAMVRCAENNLHGYERIIVGTQVANMPSIQLYDNLGFRVVSASYVFHYHN